MVRHAQEKFITTFVFVFIAPEKPPTTPF